MVLLPATIPIETDKHTPTDNEPDCRADDDDDTPLLGSTNVPPFASIRRPVNMRRLHWPLPLPPHYHHTQYELPTVRKWMPQPTTIYQLKLFHLLTFIILAAALSIDCVDSLLMDSSALTGDATGIGGGGGGGGGSGAAGGGLYLDKIGSLEKSIAAVFNKVAYGSTTTKRSIPDTLFVPSLTTVPTPPLTTFR